MGKRKISRVAMGFIVLVALVILLMFSNSLRRTARITLPPADSSAGESDGGSAPGGRRPDGHRGDVGDRAGGHCHAGPAGAV